ncbi:MAG: glutathione S-transferase N-terminal domain-containing protein, partial [Brevundimonas sp.]
MDMIDVYGDRRSGNCLKVLWLLQALGRPYRWRDVDVLGGGARTPAFRALNIAGQVPVVAFQDGRTLAQSNAILLHLAEGGPLIPSEPHDRAAMFQWLFWEQYSHEPFLAVRRFQKVY